MVKYRDYQEDLEKSDVYQLAYQLGFRPGYRPKNEKAVDILISSAKAVIQEKKELTEEEESKLTAEQKELYNNIQKEAQPKEEKTEEKKNAEENSPQEEVSKEASEAPTTTAELMKEEEPEPVHEDVDWIKQKRDFWKRYAGDIAHDFKEKEDAPEGTFEGSLYNGEKSQGSVRYTAPDRVEISKDSELVTYVGVVKDVFKDGNTLTLGNSLNDKQKLMFYAAVLKEGSKVKIMNPPALTEELISSKAFKDALPKDVQEILNNEYNRIEAEKAAKEKEAKAKAEAEAKAAKESLEQIDEKIKKIREEIAKAETDKEKIELRKQALSLVKEKLALDNNANVLNTDEREQVRKDQLGLMQQTFDADPNKTLFKSKDGKIDQEKAERNVAARMGIISGEKTSTGTEIKKDDKYAERKKAQNPLYEKYLMERYASKRS